MSDVFIEKTKRAIQDRAGNRCSNPDCRVLTSGPNAHPEKSTKTGVAAHITAASPGGARFDPSLTTEQRRSAENGIWLCQTCAHFIDTDYLNYPVQRLYEWKFQAEFDAECEIKRLPKKTSSTDGSRSRENQEEGWICPFCGTVVGLGKFVCLGCHAEVVPGLTKNERVEQAKTGMMAGFALSAIFLYILPSWILSYFELSISFSGNRFLFLFIFISAIITFACGRVFVYFSEKSRMQNPPRFFRSSVR
ncbi:hypothetical protein SJI19_14060 [Acerihabitans sp. TG2]|uniref:hypothetical protein n=1 Tax=Acerihabitans sp. TG2 TaxID=3096008 RepID=UPI002B22E81E|nr:hypothetical protein [Acerihabitans sp. TG2]MEA9391656.1 hypothetical protein [Acerihabitans sp. TG2]